jgi:signal transduction histidine kinase
MPQGVIKWTVEEIVELAGGLAHELRNPLSTTMINLKLLSEDLQDQTSAPEDVRRRALLKVDVLLREAERLQSLFDDFLRLAGPCPLQCAAADLSSIIDRLVEFFAPLAESERIHLEWQPPSGPVLGWVDERMLSQAILNIMINARQAMPDGGTLRIEVGRDGPWVRIDVRDSGVGIPPSIRDRILRPFFSTKAGGTGLGLAITRRIVNEHRGRLSFESEVGRGTTFTVRLPAVEPQTPMKEP